MVYVDDMKVQYGRMQMSHMVADSTAELFAMADRIGVARKWIQRASTRRDKAGAVAVTMRELARIIGKRR